MRNLSGATVFSSQPVESPDLGEYELRSGKFYVRGDGEAICLPNGNLRYFETERDAWAFLTNCDRAEIGKIAA